MISSSTSSKIAHEQFSVFLATIVTISQLLRQADAMHPCCSSKIC